MRGARHELFPRFCRALWSSSPPAQPQPTNNPTYARMKVYLDSIPAIDTHDHLWPFEKLPGYEMTENGRDESRRVVCNSYLTRVKQVTPWTAVEVLGLVDQGETRL